MIRPGGGLRFGPLVVQWCQQRITLRRRKPRSPLRVETGACPILRADTGTALDDAIATASDPGERLSLTLLKVVATGGRTC